MSPLLVVVAVAAAVGITITIVLLRTVERPEVTRWLVPLIACAWIVGIVGAVTLGLLWTDQATVMSADGLAEVRFGEPFAWVEQDQSRLDPPSFPRQQSPLTPLEYPTDVLIGPLLADLVVIGTPVVLVALALERRRTNGSVR